ncbi:RNA 2'-phosphotransferase [uncultured Roseibium sp.]|uniref:RNA 2'-phosphotransferase n=1 Tax=uncultured Roseibium sp. TaxID=1936171 RepID=UPI0026315C98|nr:RNA 2'-phosphotransferase [uncultured Roseibium sp.]
MQNITKISKQLSYWLRHCPQDAGLALSETGWANVDAVLKALSDKGVSCDAAKLGNVVALNDKQRFEFSEDGTMIRARQGHSLKIDLELTPVPPPDLLFHGTAERFLSSILHVGLKPMKRHHVHLSDNVDTAIKVGKRHGKPVVLAVDAGKMAGDGDLFYRTENGVWLTSSVPTACLSRHSGKV